MPVTIPLTDHRTTSKDLDPVTSSQILESACPDQFRQADMILQYSIGGWTGRRLGGPPFKIIPNEHAMRWFSALTISGWLSSRSSASLGRHANFVSHEPGERQPLVIVDPNSPPLSTQMGELMQRNVLDPALREWIRPNFSTSTPNYIAVVSILWMAPIVKKVFLPRTETRHRGIPRVTLEGLRKDWEVLLDTLEKLKEYGIPAIAWYHLLYPVVSQIAKSFYDRNNPEILEFWKKVVHGEGFGGRSSILSGWITAFCVFSCEGKWRIPELRIVSLFFSFAASILAKSKYSDSCWNEGSSNLTSPSFLDHLRSDESSSATIDPPMLQRAFQIERARVAQADRATIILTISFELFEPVIRSSEIQPLEPAYLVYEEQFGHLLKGGRESRPRDGGTTERAWAAACTGA
ncbi:hypothetical protein DFH09DRAFT_1501493 [Mycena vulgaris]|nr:hypothetical protein DFH09DRAFT_1501493 [Mycena vulgaris]